MSALDRAQLDAAVARLAGRLLDRRAAADHWDGCLSSSALSTATAVLALHVAVRNGYRSPAPLDGPIAAGTAWLLAHQHRDGGWGDTSRSRSNISTTAIVWATLGMLARDGTTPDAALERARGLAGAWLRQAAGDTTPTALRAAILRRYGKDRTFSVPIVTVLALTGTLGDGEYAWRLVPQLPFELAALPHRWFQHLRLPVVSYALPALIALGQVRHRFAPSHNPIAYAVRQRVRNVTHDLLRAMQPKSGGYLEATPLTSFVVMSLAAMGRTDSPVVEHGVRFLVESMRSDGGWPIDTNLATWVTTLSVGALASTSMPPSVDASTVRRWLLAQQSTEEHPFTHAAPGAWAWTPLSGGVPDADDTAGALLALAQLGAPSPELVRAARAGVTWLLDLQNRDGGIPTFCRGWGALPFDQSTPELTGHALRAWSAWLPHLDPPLQRRLTRAAGRAVAFLSAVQRPDGSWIPLWFGHEDAGDEANPAYGTARTLIGLMSAVGSADPRAGALVERGVRWLLAAQNRDGGWGGTVGLPSSVEETGVVLSALGRLVRQRPDQATAAAVGRGAAWLIEATRHPELAASPIGLYFARLWYFEELYPYIFGLEGLTAARDG